MSSDRKGDGRTGGREDGRTGGQRRVSRLGSVRTRLTLTILFIIFVSWFFSASTFLYFAAREARQLEQELRQKGRIAAQSVPDVIKEHPLVTRTWTIVHSAGQKTVMVMLYPMGRGVMPVRLMIALVLAWIAGALLARHVTRPLASLAEGAKAFQGGDFAHRVPVQSRDEFAQVATAMNDMATRVAAQLAELHEDAVRRRQLLADVAHELRSPVANVKTMLQAIEDGVANQPERRAQAVRSALQAAGRLERLVTDLLQLARLDLHELPLTLAPVDLRELARERLVAHTQAASQAGLQVQPLAEGEPVIVQADRERLAQVLDNLLDNAISYAGSGATLSVDVAVDRDREANRRLAGLPSPRVVVADTGRGIAPEDLDRIFEPFYRVESARTPAQEHAGLGLRIARGLIEAHGGTLTLTSAPGEGTKAIIQFA